MGIKTIDPSKVTKEEKENVVQLLWVGGGTGSANHG